MGSNISNQKESSPSERPKEDLKRLEFLDLSRKSISSLPILENLKILKLNFNSYDQVPENLQKLTSLEELYINQNKLTFIPKEITSLPRLKVLDVCFNKDIQKVEGVSSTIESLYCRGSNLTLFPLEFFKFENLKLLDLANNPNMKIEEKVIEHNIENLIIKECMFDITPKFINCLKRLKELDISYNKLNSLELELNLQTLNVKKNQFKFVPNIESLTELNASNNQISSDEFTFDELIQLNLENNSLTKFEAKLKKIQTLMLSNNKISKICNYKTLNHLDLSKNSLTEFVNHDLPFLKVLNLNINQIKIFESPKNLIELHLIGNKISDIPELPDSLQILKLDYNEISKVSPQLYTLKRLTYLGLTSNKIEIIDEDIKNLINLENFTLDKNFIYDLPWESISQLKKMKSFTCNDTGIRELPPKYNLNWFKSQISYDPPDLIIDNLYLGSVRGVCNHSIVKELKITHVLTVANGIPQYFSDLIKYKVIDVHDDPSENLIDFFDESVDFIKDCISKNGIIFVHCQMGISRSASVVIAYLMNIQKMKYEDAFSFVKKKRPLISPNYGFRKQLKEYENKIDL